MSVSLVIMEACDLLAVLALSEHPLLIICYLKSKELLDNDNRAVKKTILLVKFTI